jgi:hypothetical protein
LDILTSFYEHYAQHDHVEHVAFVALSCQVYMRNMIMFGRQRMTEELKDQRIIVLMTPSELEAIDEWSFTSRIRSRGEAIRRLCQIGLTYAAERQPLDDQRQRLTVAINDLVAAYGEEPETSEGWLLAFLDKVDALVDASLDTAADIGKLGVVGNYLSSERMGVEENGPRLREVLASSRKKRQLIVRKMTSPTAPSGPSEPAPAAGTKQRTK